MAGKAVTISKATDLPLHQKALSIKPEPGLSSRIENFINGLADDKKPDTAKALLVALLDATEGNVSAKQIQELEEKHQSEQLVLTDKLNEAKVETDRLRAVNDGLQQETTRLQAETERLLAENQQLTAPETIDFKFFEQLKAQEPSLFSDKDKSISDTITRFAFLFQNLDSEIAKEVNRADKAEEALKIALQKLIAIKPGQVVVSFPNEHLDNIQLMRQLLQRMGYTFESEHPQEVIHAAIAAYIELLKQFSNICKQFKPIEKLIANA